MTELSAYSEMEQMKRQIDNLSKDHLAGLLKALLDEPEVNQSVHLLVLVMRGIQKPRRASSMGSVDTVATLTELAQGMIYQEHEGKREWLRIVSIDEVSDDVPPYRDAVVQSAFSHEFVGARSRRIFGFDRPFKVKVAEGREPKRH